MKDEMIVRNHKFYKNGREVKPEFGNIEQIELLRDYDSLHKLMLSGEWVLYEYLSDEVKYIECPCSQMIDLDDFCDDAECPYCDQEYEVDYQEDNGVASAHVCYKNLDN